MAYNETHMRQLSVLPETAISRPITIIGVGGIGSNLAYLLARMGFQNLTLVDPDKVEEHNLGSQHFDSTLVDEPKALAMAQVILSDFGRSPEAIVERFTGSSDPIVISAVDSMESRMEIWPLIQANVENEWYIDARMSLEMIRLSCFRPIDDKAAAMYAHTLYPSSEAEGDACTARAIGYNTYFIASVIASLVRMIVLDEEPPFEINGNIHTFKLQARTLEES